MKTFKIFRQFKFSLAGSVCAALLLCVLFLNCTFTSFAVETSHWTPYFVNPKWSAYPGTFTIYDDGITQESNATFTNRYVYASFDSMIESYSDDSLPGGFTYNGTIGFSVSLSVPSATVNFTDLTSFTGYSNLWAMIDKVEVVIDGQTYVPFLTKTALDKATAYLTVNDLYVTTSSRVLVRVYWSGYSVIELGRANTHKAPYRVYATAYSGVVSLGSNYSLNGTTEGFKDNLGDFNDQLNQGEATEKTLTDSAFTNMDSATNDFFVNPSADVLAGAAFYVTCVTSLYNNLGSFKYVITAILTFIILRFIFRKVKGG